MKIMFSVGEASGDTHAASVAKSLKQLSPEVEMIGMGGSLMAEAGVKIVYDIKKLGFIGLVEIVKALPFFFKLRKTMTKILEEEKPDVFVCVDYPGFNMRMAKVAHEKGIPVLYYICPTIWAWHKSRGKDIAKYTDMVASIFPFEAKAYEEFTPNVTFVGHPLLDIVKPKRNFEENMEFFGGDRDATRILLMPGSRKQEIESLLDIMLTSIEKLGERVGPLQIFLPKAHTIAKEELEDKIALHQIPVVITEGDNYDLMSICDYCLAASGTATLETTMMNLPTILLYKVAPLTYSIGKMVVKVPYVGLPNIIAGKQVIPELLQDEANPDRVGQELFRLMTDENYKNQMKREMNYIKTCLGEPGAVQRVAQLIGELAMGGRR